MRTLIFLYMSELLKCNKCLKMLKRGFFYESTNKRQAGSWCKKCCKKRRKERDKKCSGVHRNLNKYGRCIICDKNQGVKYCSRCERVFLIEMQEIELGKGKTYFREGRPECKVCEIKNAIHRRKGTQRIKAKIKLSPEGIAERKLMVAYICSVCGKTKKKKWVGGKCEKCISDKTRDTALRKAYNLTAAQYNSMHDAQLGLCAICKLPETRKQKGRVVGLSVDHDHTTGKVRQLLCGHCNIGLGNLKDSVRLLEAAIEYLKINHDSDIMVD